VDFNEDFSAFHGETMLEQAEYTIDAIAYILSLYRNSTGIRSYGDPLPHPASVIVLAHSMGGIVARHLFLSPAYIPNSINTIITLSTPHAYPPAPVDAGIETIYSHANQYWQTYFNDPLSSHPLAEVALISISGGTADIQISSDATLVDSIVLPTNGFTIFTTSIPDLYTPVGHVEMMWCDQLRQRIAAMILGLLDVRQSSQTKPLAERLAVANKHLLGLGQQEVQKITSTAFVPLNEVELSNLGESIRFITSYPEIIVQSCAEDSSSCQYQTISNYSPLPASHVDRPTLNSEKPMYSGSIPRSLFQHGMKFTLGVAEADKKGFFRMSYSQSSQGAVQISLLCKYYLLVLWN